MNALTAIKLPRTSARTADRGSVQRLGRPVVECHHCKGTGKLPLSEDMLLTLDAVKYLKVADVREVITALMWEGHQTAINNRLEDLRRHGLLERTRRGRCWLYRPTDQALPRGGAEGQT